MTYHEQTIGAPRTHIKTFLTLVTVLTSLGLSLHDSQSHATSTETSTSKAQTLLDRWAKRSSLKGLKIGVAMKAIEGPQEARISSEKLYNPASGTKLLTTAAALLSWKLDKRFTTRIHGRITDGRTDKHGLWIVGGGDPKLLAEDLESIADQLTMKGLKEVVGPIHIDASIFDRENLPPAYEQKSTTSAYRASIGAFGVDYGAITVAIKPSRKSKQPRAYLTSAPGYGKIENRAKQVSGKANNLTYSLKPLDDGRMNISVGGTIGKRHPAFTHRLRMIDPNMGAAHILRTMLKNRGIKLQSTIDHTQQRPKSLPILAEHSGDTLEDLLKDVNTYSNNFMAETLFKHLGKDWSKSQFAVAKAMDSLGLKEGTYTIVNGSGLYRATQVTPSAMLHLLTKMAIHPTLGRPFKKSLAVSGEPGTLERRLRKRLKGAVFGKTGTLNEVVSLSGYIRSKHSGLLAFAIFINESSADRISRVRREIDRLIRQWSHL